MKDKILLWHDRKSAATSTGKDDFQPFIELSLLENISAPAGAVIVLPGGGYRARAFHEGMPVAQKFNELGFHAVVLQYRVAPYTWPAPQQDVMRSVALVRANAEKWNIDPCHIAVCGFSAGGHLAACSGTAALDIKYAAGDEADNVSSRPDALVLCYPVITNTPGICHFGSFQQLSGCEQPDEAFLNLTSLENQIRAATPPAFLWHTATDQAVNVENSIRFAKEMWKHGKAAELHIYPEGSHGLGLAEKHNDIRTWPELAANFLEKTGFPRHK